MGCNTVVFLLNDLMGSLEKSPKTVLFALTHPPNGDARGWREQVNLAADMAGEPRLHPQALEVLPTFHADYTQFLAAGGNCIVPLAPLRYGKTRDGKRTVTLQLPDWWQR